MKKEWDICWADTTIHADRLNKMKSYQRINHFIGMYLIANKNNMARHLNTCVKAFPDLFNFVPKTWVVPTEMHHLKSYLDKIKGNPLLICKPYTAC